MGNWLLEKRVAELGERVVKNREAKEQEKLHQVAIGTRREIVEANTYQRTDFWCNHCARDYAATGRKLVEGDGRAMSAVYVSECPDGHRNYRYITDVPNDPYWSRSIKIRADRAKYADYMLSPHDDKFRTVYRQQWLELEKQREQRDSKREPAG